MTTTTPKDKSQEGPYGVMPLQLIPGNQWVTLDGQPVIRGREDQACDSFCTGQALRIRNELNAAYAKGYAAGQADRWISVSKRLPEDETTVLVSCQFGYVGPGHIDGGAWLLHGIGEPDTGDDPITHWMPLPEPPTNP